jgi:ABC-type branched-subunit amino acid transport system substrate-binding protein
MRTLIPVLALAALGGCKKEEQPAAATAPAPSATPAAPAPKPSAAPGVDADKKVVRVGALNDESGPAAAIGKPYAVGKRLLARAVKEGDVKVLPAGWTFELVERDHGYNPQQSVQHYNAIKDEVLFIAHSFGTPNTMPLLPMLERDNVVAFPASLASQMAEHKHTPPLGPSYRVEAMRALDWVVETAGDAKKVKAAVVHQQDDYGKDALTGWLEAAKHHGVEVVDQQAVAPGQKDYAAVVTSLKEKGATHVLVATLPSGTGPLLGTAAQLGFKPVWIGNTPSWIDRFFDEKVLPPPVLGGFHWATGLTYWGEDAAAMKDFLAIYEKYGKEMSEPNFYILASYFQGMVALEALKRAIEAGAVTREGYVAALAGIEGYDAGGLAPAITLSKFPYVTSTKTRILKPKLAEKTWEEVAAYADPKALAPK